MSESESRSGGGGGRERSPAIEVRPSGPVTGQVCVPASKSLTNRALVLAALASGPSRLVRPLESEDIARMIGALESLGVRITRIAQIAPTFPASVGTGAREDGVAGERGEASESPGASDLRIEGRGGRFRAPARALDVGGSGTAMRFLAALAALVPGEVLIDGDARMRARPIGPLLAALRALGVDAVSVAGDGCPPVRVRGGRIAGGGAALPGDVSSQFVSALSMIAPFAGSEVVLDVAPPVVSRPYIDLTLSLMARFGAAPPRAETLANGGLRLTIAPRSGARAGGDADPEAGVDAGSDAGATGPYRATSYRVPPDASSAAYFFGAAALTAGRVLVETMDPSDGQADAKLLRLLPGLGCEVESGAAGTAVSGPASGRLAAFDLDMGDAPDLVPMLAVLALFADGPCVIRGAANLRVKESDRIRALATEIARLGAAAQERPDGLRIVPGPLRSARIETYDDHRIAMAFAVAGLATPGVTIADPGCVAKSFPGFWTTLARVAPGAVR